MVTIEDKIDSFSKLIYEGIDNASQEKIKAVEEKNKKLIEEHKKEYMKKAEAITDNMNRKIAQKKNEMVSKATMDNKQRLLAKKKSLLELLINEQVSRAKEFVSTDKYTPYFKKSFNEILAELESFEGIKVELLQEDRNKFQTFIEGASQEKGIPIDQVTYKEGNKRMIGGVIVYNYENTIRYDASIASLLEDKKPFILKKMYEELEKVGDQIDK